MNERTAALTGGCQCGAVRYALYAAPEGASICHCRMCQKAFGSYFGPFAGVTLQDFSWTRGRPGIFKSSEAVERGFCRDCGTPLSFHYVGTDRISVSIGSLDEPARVTPEKQLSVETALPSFAGLATLPAAPLSKALSPEWAPKLVSRQHPDHD